jgi:hypothetical protein
MKDQLLDETLAVLREAGITPHNITRKRHVKVSFVDAQQRKRIVVLSHSPSCPFAIKRKSRAFTPSPERPSKHYGREFVTDTIDLLLKELPPKQEPATAAIYTFEARSAEQYDELLQSDPRPWWWQATPRKKTRLKNVKLTNALTSSSSPSSESAAPDERPKDRRAAGFNS